MTVDTSNWPIWLVALLLLVNLFRAPLGGMINSLFPALGGALSARAERQADRDEHDQRMEKMEHLRKSWREENLMEILRDKDIWERDLFGALSGAIKEQTRELQQMRLVMIRNNDLLVVLNTTMQDMSDRQEKDSGGQQLKLNVKAG